MKWRDILFVLFIMGVVIYWMLMAAAIGEGAGGLHPPTPTCTITAIPRPSTPTPTPTTTWIPWRPTPTPTPACRIWLPLMVK